MFKQNTADELRISDCSSDVCSSNRLQCQANSEKPMNVALAKEAVTAKAHVLQSNPETIHWGYWDGSLNPVLTISSGDRVRIECVSEIGRASCRERVCQYV